MKQRRLNAKPFSEVCHNSFGREVIYTNEERITAENIVKELNKALSKHQQNREEIDYLYHYYKGNQPILYRNKTIRPEINNRIVQNTAYFIVETKTADIASEPIQYVLRGADENKSKEIAFLNSLMDEKNKSYIDTCLARWRSICGTSYRSINKSNGQSSPLDKSSFYITVNDPRDTFIVYYNSNIPAFSCSILKDKDNKTIYFIYTNTQWFVVSKNKIIEKGNNGFLAIPITEYPNNENRISDIEITISISDAINSMSSDRQNGLEQFVASFVKFVNCEMDSEKFAELRNTGAFIVNSNNGDNKADVDIMSNELNQTEGQVAIDDLFNKLLMIQGIANREGNTGGDTQGAVSLRNGWYDSERRAELTEPIFKKAEKTFLRVLLHYLKTKNETNLDIMDIEIKISRSKMDNMLVKAETLKMLLDSGVYPPRAIKSVGFFPDPEQVAIESKERFDVLYPTEIENEDRPTE